MIQFQPGHISLWKTLLNPCFSLHRQTTAMNLALSCFPSFTFGIFKQTLKFSHLSKNGNLNYTGSFLWLPHAILQHGYSPMEC